ncbi:beta-ketoacyl synthase chain length factor [Maribellus mangrovi]|uniref:beta-ketoacyl synthase chain length factor n=1 Tax=Maribellus mangrovi TaxID=3133146 RepID=UPI0030EE7729
METRLYINGTGNISKLKDFEESCAEVFEPDYRELIAAPKLRRMSRIMKMNSYAALSAIKNTNTEAPEAINSATGYGCLSDTEKFLQTFLENKEQFSNPSAFINSTHNSLAGNLALLLGIKGQNFTFVHEQNSFENALIDAALGFEEGSFQNIMVGGADEKTSLVDTISEGLSCKPKGEGAAYLYISKVKTDSSFAVIRSINLDFKNTNLNDFVFSILEENKLIHNDFDFLINGTSLKLPDFSNQIMASGFTGDYPTVAALLVVWACEILKSQSIKFPVVENGTYQRILVINKYPRGAKSAIIVEKA